MMERVYIRAARVLYKSASFLYRVSDKAGESEWTSWMQKPLDLISSRLSSWSAELLMKGYWMIKEDADWEQ